MFKFENFMGKKDITSSLLKSDDVISFFTTRDLPLKYGEREDLKEEIELNKKLVCKGLNIPIENLYIPQQTHSSNVEIINPKKKIYPQCDGLITNKKNIAIALNFADCVPLVFYDSTKKVVAISHAGWRGTVEKIGLKTVKLMIKNFNCNPEEIIAIIGPSIGRCCFQVKDDVLEQLHNSIDNQNLKAFSNNHADLKLINKYQLLATGIKKIDVCEYCTSCNNELFFSYRKENGNTARHSAVIMLKN